MTSDQRYLYVVRERQMDGTGGAHSIWEVKPKPTGRYSREVRFLRSGRCQFGMYLSRKSRLALGIKALKPGQIVRVPIGKAELV